MFTVYILRSLKNHLYVGSTKNFSKRYIRHIKGDGAEFVRRNKTLELVYSEKFKTLIEARQREKQIKGWKREKKENIIKFGRPYHH